MPRFPFPGLMEVLFAASLLAVVPGKVAANAAIGHERSRSALCEVAASAASKRHGVPPDVLRAISLVETGRITHGTLRPWPWAVNMEGEGHWFPDEAVALAFVRRAIAGGARSFDLGCFQINALWHGKAFASLEDMIDPDRNADYAARFLAALYLEFGDWSRAAGAYHSRTPELAASYRKRFDRVRGRAPDNPDRMVQAGQPDTKRLPVRENLYPLLQPAGRTISPGSLFRSAGTPSRPILGRP